MKSTMALLSLIVTLPFSAALAQTQASAGCLDCDIKKISEGRPLISEDNRTIAQKIIERDGERFLSPEERLRRQKARAKAREELLRSNPQTDEYPTVDFEIDDKILPRLDYKELEQILALQNAGSKNMIFNFRITSAQDYQNVLTAHESLAKARWKEAARIQFKGDIDQFKRELKAWFSDVKDSFMKEKAAQQTADSSKEELPKKSVLLSEYEAGKEERAIKQQAAEAEARYQARVSKNKAVTKTIVDGISLESLAKGVSVGRDSVKIRLFQQNTSDRMISVSVEKGKNQKPSLNAGFAKDNDGLRIGASATLQKTADGRSNHGAYGYIQVDLCSNFEKASSKNGQCGKR